MAVWSSEHEGGSVDRRRNVLCPSFHRVDESSELAPGEPEGWTPPTMGVTLAGLCTKDLPFSEQFQQLFFSRDKANLELYHCFKTHESRMRLIKSHLFCLS